MNASFDVSGIGNHLDEILNYADLVLYKAKNNKENLVVADESNFGLSPNQIKTIKKFTCLTIDNAGNKKSSVGLT
jgi:hypothetical protein